MPPCRLVLWAHNGHIGNHHFVYVRMGHHLEVELGKDYRPIGFPFHHGGLLALDATWGAQGPGRARGRPAPRPLRSFYTYLAGN